MYVSPDAKTSDNPTWTERLALSCPSRPVAAFAVDRSNYRIAYVAYEGFNAATLAASRATSSRRPTAATSGRTSAGTD